LSPSVLSPFAIETDVREVQPEKALSPMLITLFGIVIVVRPVHPLNAPAPILVTLSGIVTDKKVDPAYAFAAILVTPRGILTIVIHTPTIFIYKNAKFKAGHIAIILTSHSACSSI